MERKIYADFDGDGVYIYQAFKPEIVKEAVAKGTFGKGFGLDRITWIKPSFGWMLYRSEYASKYRMEAIAKIKIAHQSWLEILSQSIETSWNPEIYQEEWQWQDALNQSEVIHQWDPERDLAGKKTGRSAIQIGIRGEIIKKYVAEYITTVQDVTDLAKTIGKFVKGNKIDFEGGPEEKEYPLDNDLFVKLGGR